MNAYDPIERRIIKKDAKIVLMQNFRGYFCAGLPVLILEVLFSFRSFFPFPNEWIMWCTVAVVGILAYLPLTMGRSAYILAKIQEKPNGPSGIFRWVLVPKLWARALWFSLICGVFYVIYAGAAWLLYLPYRHLAVMFSDFISNPDALEYLKQVFFVAALFGAVLLEMLFSPAKNLLVSEKMTSVPVMLKRSFQCARQNFKTLLMLRVTFIGWIMGTYFFNMAASGNAINALSASAIWMQALYFLLAAVFLLFSFYVSMYMETAMLSYNDVILGGAGE